MVEVILYQDEDGTCPVLAFLDEEPLVVQQKAFQHIEQLKTRGHTARRPLVENLGEGLWELRFHHRRVQYRILFFFHGRAAVVLAHALTKEEDIPAADRIRALRRKSLFTQHPTRHTYHGALQ